MKTIFGLVLIAAMAIFLRAGLPSDNIGAEVSANAPADTGLIARAAARVAGSHAVAAWRIYDLAIFKVARSERLDVTIVAIPYVGWRQWDGGRG